MFALDLFNNDYERRLTEGAVDNLEARRIDDLNMKLDDLVARAKQATTPEVKAALIKEFQKFKAERDSYYHVKDEGMFSPLGEETHEFKGAHGKLDVERTPGKTVVRRKEYPGADDTRTDKFPNSRLRGKGSASQGSSGSSSLNTTPSGAYRKMPRLDHDANDISNYEVDEAGIPGNVPADKIPGKEDLLKGKGRSYYESVEEGNPSKKVFKDKAGNPVGEIGIDPESSPGNGEWYVYHYGTGYSVVGFDNAAEAKRELMYVHKHPEAVEGHESTFNEAGIPGSVPTEKIPGKEDLLKGKGRSYYESNQKKNLNLSKGVIPTEPLPEHGGGIGPKQHWQDLVEAPQLHVGDPIVVTAPNEFEGKTGEISEFSPSGKFVVVNLYNHGEHSMHLSDVEYNQYAADQEDEDDWYDDGAEDTLEETQLDEATARDVLLGLLDKFYADMKLPPRQGSHSGALDIKSPGTKVWTRGDGTRLRDPGRIKASHWADDKKQAEKAASNFWPWLLKQPGVKSIGQVSGEFGSSQMKDAVGYKGLYFSGGPYGTEFGSMSRVTNPKSVWRHKPFELEPKDEQGVAEGFQDFNKVEPYAVCLAGKPVKKFDYYEEARRFHDNWKKKLYNAGDKAKADKITLLPLNLDEATPRHFGPKGAGTELARQTRQAEIDRKFNTPELLKKDADYRDYRAGIKKTKVQVKKNKGVAEGDDLTHAGQDVMVWTGPPTNNPPRDDKKYWIRGKLDSTEMHGGSMRANVMTAKGMYNPELSRVFKAEQGVAEVATDYSKRRQRERDIDAGKPVAKQRPSKMTDYQKRRAQQKKEMELGEQVNEDIDTSPVVQAIIKRILVAHKDLLAKFGPEKIMNAAEDVAYNVGDFQEIGSSDVSQFVHQVKQMLGAE